MKNSTLNFGGFYNSTHIDLVENMITSYFNLDDISELSDNIEINYQKIFNAYSIEYVSNFNEYITDAFKLELELELIKLDSPKYFNFETDTIEVAIKNEDTFIKLFINDNDFIKYANEKSKSCEGFYSFYDGIKEIRKYSEILIQYIFNYILEFFYEDELMNYYDRSNSYELLYNLDNFYTKKRGFDV